MMCMRRHALCVRFKLYRMLTLQKGSCCPMRPLMSQRSVARAYRLKSCTLALVVAFEANQDAPHPIVGVSKVLQQTVACR